MSTSHSRKILAAAVVWLLIAGAGAAVYKFVSSRRERQAVAESVRQYEQLAHQAKQLQITPPSAPNNADVPTIAKLTADLQSRIDKARLLQDTTPAPKNPLSAQNIKLALDSFSGYCLLRSDDFRSELAAQGVTLELVDDKADYSKRIAALHSGQVQLAAFTIDALIKHSDAIGALPATIVMVIDETRGADAMVAYRQAVPNLDALNRPDARLVFTPDSPSETLARVVVSDFNLPELTEARWLKANDPAEVFERFRTATKSQPQAFILWEPYVSKALEQPDAGVVVDSSKFQGIIVDVLVAERSFLRDNAQHVALVVRAYMAASFASHNRKGGLTGLVSADARTVGESLTESQAERLVQGIWWKNTLENYAHFGVLAGSEAQGLQHIEDMIRKITAILIKTRAIPRDPTEGSPQKLYFPNILAQLQRENFHPGLGGGGAAENIRTEQQLPALSDEEWTQLIPVGTLHVEPIRFGRMSAELLDPGRAALDNLASSLRTWPQYYVMIEGRSRPEGDADANRLLAMQRARAAETYLTEQGLPAARTRTQAHVEASGTGGLGQSVSFRLLQKSY